MHSWSILAKYLYALKNIIYSILIDWSEQWYLLVLSCLQLCAHLYLCWSFCLVSIDKIEILKSYTILSHLFFIFFLVLFNTLLHSVCRIIVLFSHAYCNKLPETQWFNTTESIFLSFGVPRSEIVSLGQNKHIYKGAILLEVLGNSISCLFPVFNDF